MCGIAGFWGKRITQRQTAEGMAHQIQTRGPDDAGVWVDYEAGFALAHRRLSILDVSTAGHQPMESQCGGYVLVYNGEIYNHMDLRAELEQDAGGYPWRGHSDTETLLAGIAYWGVERCLEKLNGMFAFALWDRDRKQLTLARDRMGEKPLYYGHSDGVFLFGSELKALQAHPSWKGVICTEALDLFTRYGYVPTPWSIYQGIKKLPPAHFVVISDSGQSICQPQFYWDLAAIAQSSYASEPASSNELTDELDGLVLDAVGRQMAADVPLGAFLSGGYDSTLVVAAMQFQSERPVQTFSIGFHEAAYNEADHAKAVANHLGTSHTELYVTPDEAMSVIPQLPGIYDEPFADSSQIPTFLVSKLAREHVTVSLSGDGGDELFYGYGRYEFTYQTWNKLRRFPRPMRRALATMMRHSPGLALERAQELLPEKLRVAHLADRLPKMADLLASESGKDFYRSLVSGPLRHASLVRGNESPETILDKQAKSLGPLELREWMMYIDQVTYLPNDILTKVDRASMAVSLEARVPLLDHRLVEFAWRVPTEYKYRDGQGKWLLRQVLYLYVPRALMDRPKMGFGVPIEHWLRGPLREWAEALLDERRIRQEGFFNPEPIRKMWAEHLSGKRRWHEPLWNILMFQAWHEHWHKA